jgi:hypothetical protein
MLSQFENCGLFHLQTTTLIEQTFGGRALIEETGGSDTQTIITDNALFLEEPPSDYHLCDIRCQSLNSLDPLSPKTS